MAVHSTIVGQESQQSRVVNSRERGGRNSVAIFPPREPNPLPVDTRLATIADLLKLQMAPKNLYVDGSETEMFIAVDPDTNRYVLAPFENALGVVLRPDLDAMVSTTLDHSFKVIFDNQGGVSSLAQRSSGELNPPAPPRQIPQMQKGPLGDINLLKQAAPKEPRDRNRANLLDVTVDNQGNFTHVRQPQRTPLESYPDMGPTFAHDHEIHLLKMPRTLLLLRDLLNQYTNSYLGDVATHQHLAQLLNRLLFDERKPTVSSTCLLTLESWEHDVVANLTANARISFDRIQKAIEESKNQPYGVNMALTIGKPNQGDMAMLLDYYQQSKGIIYDPNLAALLSRENKSMLHWTHIFENIPEGFHLDPVSLGNLGLCEISEKPTTWQEDLDNLVGMDAFKTRLLEIKQAQEAGKLGKHPNLNFCFIGPTGVGKTEAAKILGKFFQDIGVLNRGHIIEKTKGGIVAGYVGQTGIQTKKLIEDSKGGVLFIDEAHNFAKSNETGTVHNQGFDDDVLAEIIPEMENSRGDRAIVFAGYPEGMKDLLDSDEGFRGRFLPENIIEFKPYNDTELYEIFKTMARTDGYGVDRATQRKVTRIINGMPKGSKTFGNARAMRQLFESMKIKSANRDEPMLRITDIPSAYEVFDVNQIVSLEDLEERFDGLVGLEDIKDKLTGIFLRIQLDKSRNMPLDSLAPLIFSGNPGTGKTTVARIMGSMMKGLGLLQSSEVHECTRAYLVASYEGQTAQKIRNAVIAAVDGVFFLDEAYALIRESQGFGQEAIDELVKLVEEYKDKVLFIFAGYPVEMKKFRSANPGLFSRLPDVINFKDFTKPELIQILHLKLAEKKAIIDETSLNDEDYLQFIDTLKQPNARSIATAANNIITAHARRTNSKGEFDANNNLVINRQDLMSCVNNP